MHLTALTPWRLYLGIINPSYREHGAGRNSGRETIVPEGSIRSNGLRDNAAIFSTVCQFRLSHQRGSPQLTVPVTVPSPVKFHQIYTNSGQNKKTRKPLIMLENQGFAGLGWQILSPVRLPVPPPGRA